MTVYKQGMKAECPEDGIWLDFRSNTWIFVIRDSGWVKEELRMAAHSDINITFVQKGIVDAFLLEIYDCMDTSDVPFCIKDADEVLLRSLNEKKDYDWEVVITDGNNDVLAVRNASFETKDSRELKKRLKERYSEGFTSDDFDKAYAKLSQRYEPFEMEPFAVFTERNKGR